MRECAHTHTHQHTLTYTDTHTQTYYIKNILTAAKMITWPQERILFSSIGPEKWLIRERCLLTI